MLFRLLCYLLLLRLLCPVAHSKGLHAECLFRAHYRLANFNLGVNERFDETRFTVSFKTVFRLFHDV
jgi:hypothetical protein